MRGIKSAAAVVAALAFAGCGYAIGYPKAGPVASAKTAAVPMFANGTHEAGAEVLFTEALRREFSLDPQTGVRGAGEAELTITGTVTTLSSWPVSFLSGVKGLAIGEYNITASVTVKAETRGRSAPVYANAFSGTEQYLSANDPVGTESNRRMAMQRLARRMMKEAHDLMMAAF